jgi:threonine dehydrogenase-like Zn-dependent dehydrogenase
MVYAQGVREAVEAVASGRLDPVPLYTHRYPLERLGEALDATRDKPDHFVKAIITL